MGTISPEKLKKIQEFIDLQKESLTNSEFLDAFKQVIDYVKKIEKELNSKTQSAINNLESLGTNIKQKVESEILDMRSEHKTSFSNLKRWALDGVARYFASSQLNGKINEIDNKLAELKGIKLPDASTIALEASRMAKDGLLPMIPIVDKIEDELPELGEKIRDGLENLQGDDRLDKSAIKGLEEELQRIGAISSIGARTGTGFITGGGGVGKTNVYYYDLSDKLNGVLKTFSLPAFLRILDVKLSSSPVLRPLVDWTSDSGASTITFTSTIDADPLLLSGQSLIILYAI